VESGDECMNGINDKELTDKSVRAAPRVTMERRVRRAEYPVSGGHDLRHLYFSILIRNEKSSSGQKCEEHKELEHQMRENPQSLHQVGRSRLTGQGNGW
jgi:CRISPR/Cas system-associated protein Cas7 (RAMP superfamily)